jgi:hypothetical protein
VPRCNAAMTAPFHAFLRTGHQLWAKHTPFPCLQQLAAVRLQCMRPSIVGCSQRSRHVVEQKHMRPCLTSSVPTSR